MTKGIVTTDPKSDMNQALLELYKYANEKYKQTFPADYVASPSLNDDFTNEKNPLYRFMAYQVLPRKMDMPAYLTVRDDLGIFTKIMNPTEWYETMLTYTLMKVEKYTVDKSGVGSTATLNDHYVNRRFDYDATKGFGEKIEGVHVKYDVESQYENEEEWHQRGHDPHMEGRSGQAGSRCY